jgi:tetratricopeptide (TPR) repeat protein
MRRTILVTTKVAILALALAAPAQAQRRQSQTAQPSPEARETAREAYSRGQQLFREGDFEGAEAAFNEAYAAVPNPVVLLGLAEVHERAGAAPRAVEALERYLAERADAPDRAPVEERIARLRALPATLVVTSTPADAAITIDGSPREERTPAEIEVPPGEHTVSLLLDGHEEATSTLEATFGTRHEVALELAEIEAEEEVVGDEEIVEEELPPLEEEPEPETLPAGVWIASGLAAAGMVGGTVLGFLALSKQSDFDETPTDDVADDGERLALFADVAFGVAAVAGITAIVLYLTADEPLEEDEEDAGAAVSLSPVVGPAGGGLSAVGRF